MDPFLKTVIDGAGTYHLTLFSMIFALYGFSWVKLLIHRANSQLRKKYTLVVFTTPILNLILTMTFNAQAMSANAFVVKSGGWVDPSSLASDLYYTAQITIFGYYLTILYYLITVITILIQKPLNKESVSNP